MSQNRQLSSTIAYAKFENVIAIDRNRNVIYDFVS